jgi:hypothetical protein
VGERRVRVVAVARRELLDPSVREPREIGRRPLEGGEGKTPRLVLEGDGDVRPPGECLQQAPLRSAQILEAVGVDRTPIPGTELAGEACGRIAAPEVTIPEPKAVELAAISPVQLGQVAVELSRLEQPRLELGDRASEGVREPREPSRDLKVAEPSACDHPPQKESPLCLADERTGPAVPGRDLFEGVVERPDETADERAGAAQEIALDPFDVRPGRHDQHRLPTEIRQVAIEEQRHLAGIRRPGEQRQGHQPILVPGSDSFAKPNSC